MRPTDKEIKDEANNFNNGLLPTHKEAFIWGAKWVRDNFQGDAVEFAEWVEKNYSLVKDNLNNSAWVNHNDNHILVNGSDKHYLDLIVQVGKTTTELYELFINTK